MGKEEKKKYPRKFRQAWLKIKEFSEWLHEVPGDITRAYCSFCRLEITAKVHQLFKHSQSKKHLNAAPDPDESIPGITSLSNFLKLPTNNNPNIVNQNLNNSNHKKPTDECFNSNSGDDEAQSSSAKNSSQDKNYEFKTLKITSPGDFIKHVELNRPDKRNAMNTAFWKDIHTCFTKLAEDPDCRVVVLSGSGKMFTAGLDLFENEMFKNLLSSENRDASRKAFQISSGVRELQESFNVIEKCPKPVIAAVHNGCIGGGIDMISCCDIRYCSQDAWFQIKEVDIGLAADLGTIQRFPKIIGNDSLYRELAYTCRRFDAEEAKSMGFVSRILPDKKSLIDNAVELARVIASKSPVAVQGTKVNSVYSRDHGVYEGLEYIATWNSTMLQSEDVGRAVSATMRRDTPVFSKL